MIWWGLFILIFLRVMPAHGIICCLLDILHTSDDQTDVYYLWTYSLGHVFVVLIEIWRGALTAWNILTSLFTLNPLGLLVVRRVNLNQKATMMESFHHLALSRGRCKIGRYILRKLGTTKDFVWHSHMKIIYNWCAESWVEHASEKFRWWHVHFHFSSFFDNPFSTNSGLLQPGKISESNF